MILGRKAVVKMNDFRCKKDIQGKPTRYFSKLQENHVAKAVNGSTTKNSGATMFQKSDVLNDLYTIECKTKMSDSKQITLKEEWFEKQKQESLFMGKPYYAIAFNFGPNKPMYYCVDELTFQELLEFQNKGA